MSIQNVLKSMAGKHSKGNVAPIPKFPIVDAKTQASYEKISSRLEKIRADMKGIGEDGGGPGELERLAKKARKLEPLVKATKDLKKAEAEFNKVRRDSTKSVHDLAKATDKLAAAKKRHNQVANETNGIMGRFANVLGSLTPGKLALMAVAVVMRDVVLVSKQAEEGFDVMARTGNALGKSFADLTAATWDYSVGLNAAAISGGMMGHSGEDSKKAFQNLTRTFGGTGKAVANVSSNFGTMAKVAKFSGMSIGDAALYADKNFARLGKGIKSSIGDIAQMGVNTAELNDLFGQGKVDTQAYAQTVSDLSFQSGNYNQNTKFLIESLNRELAVQFALGKSREAAMDAAKKNLTKAGEANILGAMIIGKKLQEQFDRGMFDNVEGKALAKEKFGAQYEVVLEILKQGVATNNNQFALAEVMKGSTEMQGKLWTEARKDAAKGGQMALATGIVGDIGEMRTLQVQEELIAAKMAAIKAVPKEDRKGLDDRINDLFSGISEIEDPERRADAQKKAAEFGTKIRMDPEVDARQLYTDTIKAIYAEDIEKGKDPTEAFLEKVEGAGFMNMISVVTHMPDVIRKLPVSIAFEIARKKAEKSGLFKWVANAFKPRIEDDGTRQRLSAGGMPMYTEEQMAEARRQKAFTGSREQLGKDYDAAKLIKGKDGGMGTSAVRNKTRAQFIEEGVKAKAAEAFTVSPAAQTQRDMEAIVAEAAAAGDPRAAALLETIGMPGTPEATRPAEPTIPKKEAGTGPWAPGELTADAFSDGGDTLLRVQGLQKLVEQWKYESTAKAPPTP